MAKKTKDTTTTTAKKDAKARAPADPAKTRSLIRLLNILALLLAITAFLLQFFAVLTHNWKHQVTRLRPLLTPDDTRVQEHAYDDESRLDQRYGLFTRDVRLYAKNDEYLNVWPSTRFPRLDDGEDNLHACLARTTTLRGAYLTCSNRALPPEQCHCRRYPHWNAIIFFEITALVLLGIVVVICSLLTTQYHGLLKPIGVALSFLAFLFMLIGLIILLSYLKRETRTLADTYPHMHDRLAQGVGLRSHRHPTGHRHAVRRQTHESYRAYNLSPGQHYYNDTHFQQYSEQERKWIYIPYTSLDSTAYAPRSQQGRVNQPATTQRATEAPVQSRYGPVIGYNQVYDNTRACIGWSAILSILSLILSLLLPLLLAFSWLTGKKLGPETTTVTTTTVRTEYVPVPQDVTVETVPLTRPVATQGPPYDNYGARAEVGVVREDQPITTTHTQRT